MVKKIKQFRYYNDTDNNISIPQLTGASPQSLNMYSPIIHLGIQTLPGTKIYLNGFYDAPIIIGATGIYELDLEGTTGLIDRVQVDENSMNTIKTVDTAYIIIDIVYQAEED